MIAPRYALARPEFKLLFFLAYVASLLFTWLAGYGLAKVIIIHFLFVLIVSIVSFGPRFAFFLVSPIFAVFLPIQSLLVKRYLRQFPKNSVADAAVILGHADWTKLEAWVKPIFSTSEIKALVKYLRAKNQTFSFYPDATIADVEKVMRDNRIKEVYFFGHGNSHEFQLGTEEILYYCDFNDPAYSKEFVHQVHCGDKYGKSLVDYVVSEENRAKCFFFRKPINGYQIIKEFKGRTRQISA